MYDSLLPTLRRSDFEGRVVSLSSHPVGKEGYYVVK